MLPLKISRIGGEQLFLRRFFHHVTLRAGTESALCEDGFLESGVNENQQSRTLRFERFKKFEAVAGTQPQCSQQQVRLATPGSCGAHHECCQSPRRRSCPAGNSEDGQRRAEAAGALPKRGFVFLQDAFLGRTCALRTRARLFAISAEQMSSREFSRW